MSRVVILTGAGISAESGLGTFRAENGLWAQHRVEDVATPEGFRADPALVHRFYNMRRAESAGADPNEAHRALARLEAELDGGVTIVTQNVDDLHERGGAQNIIHMHGALAGSLCAACDHRWPSAFETTPADLCPHCATPNTRPDIVWFGEMPYQMDRIFGLLQDAEIFAAIGTSGNVYPAAGFAHEARRSGAHTVELNLEPSMVVNDFVETRFGPATRTVPEWVAELLG
ncbi:MAG: NAD-dependent deacylase [Paracoccaceae bacterium]|jgi:NAD-dependent deacetylase|nr:NAD-dependent deacylase [Paracoccaceae bacterium]MDP7184524.1 NAD-dependent deacylase [Paracoccaceae bacterium]